MERVRRESILAPVELVETKASKDLISAQTPWYIMVGAQPWQKMLKECRKLYG